MITGYLPPQSIELEEAVLGAILIQKHSLQDVADFLKPEHFYNDNHQQIYQAIINLFKKSLPIDILTVSNELKGMGKLETIGNFYIVELTSRVSNAAHIEAHAKTIIENWVRRELIKVSQEVSEKAYQDTTDVFDLLALAGKYQDEMHNVIHVKKERSYADVVGEAAGLIENRKESFNGITGVASGFNAVDRETGGWQKSDLIIVAGRPSMGKTAFVLNCAENAAIDFDTPVAFFSLEMSSVQLSYRSISRHSEIMLEKILRGKMDEWEYPKLNKAYTKLENAPMIIDDTAALSVLEFRAKARRLKQKHNIGMIVVDYLQLMRSEGRKSGNREQEISEISRALKAVAKELNIPVIALSQLSRKVEDRRDCRPMLSDLRESGAIEQDADMVVFLYRPEYYGFTEDGEGRSTIGVAEVIIAKNRNGVTGTVPLRFIGKFTSFADLEDDFQTTPNPTAGIEPSKNFEKQEYIIKPNFYEVEKDDDEPF